MLRCLSNLYFLDRFYQEFISSSQEVAEAFAHTDMERQKAMLTASMYHLANLIEKRDEEAHQHMEELGAIHGSHGLDIPSHLYDKWLESLLIAVSESDPAYDEKLESVWREVMLYGINLMKASVDKKPKRSLDTKSASHGKGTVIEIERVVEVIRVLNQLGKEAAQRSNLEKDMESTAFQFGQYRAYLHASNMLLGVLNKKTL